MGTVLHDQVGGPGARARAGRHLPHRQATRRRDQGGEPEGRRDRFYREFTHMPGVGTRKDVKVLIVEDEQPLRELLQMELSRSGYKVQVAGNGEEGLAMYKEQIFNIVLLDVRMPGADGVQILQLTRAESNIPEVIMFTGHGTIETAVECLKHGAYDYLTKPVKLDELEIVIDKAYEKNRLRLENINLKLEVHKFE